MLLPQTEMKLFSNQINLVLLNDIIAFVLSTSETTYAQRRALSKGCIFLDDQADSDAFQKKYGFLYLGELLERYESRFQMPIQDLRAIALALGYTRDIVTDAMFVGSQRADFMRRLRRQASDDPYLTGALYLLQSDDGKNAIAEDKLIYEYSTIEELVFAVSLLQDSETIFPRIKEQLLRLLGNGCTASVLGNMRTLNWLISWLIPRVKAARGKDLALLRAFSALPTSFVKPESKPYTILAEHGYTPLEITYANMMAVLSQTAAGVLRTDSIVTQKIVVALFEAILGHNAPLSMEVYDLLSDVYRRYAQFHTRCYGCGTLSEALNKAPHISNAETFLWFSQLAGIRHPALADFDILDGKWDVLAATMDPGDYQALFELGLDDSLSTEEIQRRIDRYDALAGKSYLTVYQSRYDGSHFDLLVGKQIIDLWEEFQASLNPDQTAARPDTVDRIRNYLYRLSTIQAYQFYEKFIGTYGIQKSGSFFREIYRNFYTSLVNETNYHGCHDCALTLDIDQRFLDDDKRRQLLVWLEEYVFLYRPEKYLPFATTILSNEAAAGLFPQEDQRALFDMVITQTPLSWSTISSLKRRYLTEEEKQAELAAEKLAKQRVEQQRQLDLSRELQEEYVKQSDKTFAYDENFLDRYRYRRESEGMAGRIVLKSLEERLSEPGYQINGTDTAHLFAVCARLIKLGLIDFHKVKKYILEIKECVDHANCPD